MAWLYWLIAIIFFTIAEALTVSMISVWFIVGSLVAMFVSLFGGTVTWQIISFIVISTIGLIIYLVWIKQRLTRNDKIIERLVSHYKAIIEHYHHDKAIPEDLLFDIDNYPIYN